MLVKIITTHRGNKQIRLGSLNTTTGSGVEVQWRMLRFSQQSDKAIILKIVYFFIKITNL